MVVGVTAAVTPFPNPVSEAPSLRVALVDQDRLFSRGLELILERVSGGAVLLVHATGEPRRALEMVRRQAPDVAIVGPTPPAAGGPATIRALKQSAPHRPVLAVAADHDRTTALALLQAGADGLVDQSTPPETLLAVLQTLAAGAAAVPARLLADLVEAPVRPHLPCLRWLGSDELELWRQIARGLDTAEIRRALHVSERTAKRRTASLLRRLGVANRVQAAALAGRSGILDPR